MCTLYLTLFDSRVCISFNSYMLNQTHGIALYLLYMFPMVGLHMFYSILIILMFVNKYH
jgi:hypothetical protein